MASVIFVIDISVIGTSVKIHIGAPLIYIYIIICVRVCVRVCVSDSGPIGHTNDTMQRLTCNMSYIDHVTVHDFYVAINRKYVLKDDTDAMTSM